MPQTRTPDAHFFTEARYKGTKMVAVTPDYSEVAKLSDLWLHPKQGTDAAVAMAMGHVILKEFYLDRQGHISTISAPLHRHADAGEAGDSDGDRLVPDRYVRASDLDGRAEADQPEWKTVAFDENGDGLVVPHGAIGFRWAEGRRARGPVEPGGEGWRDGEESTQAVALSDTPRRAPHRSHSRISAARKHEHFPENDQGSDVLVRKVPVATDRARRRRGAGGHRVRSSSANYGVDRGLGGDLRHELRRQRALHAGVAGDDHWRAARSRRSRWRVSSRTTRRRPTAGRW